MRLTPAQKKALIRVDRLSKGWPVGIPVHRRTAVSLVNLKMAEWAQPAAVYPKPVYSIRLTAWGLAHINH